MTILDYVVIVILVLAALSGLSKGLVRQLAALAGFAIGLLAARALYSSVAVKISPWVGTSTNVAEVVAFIAIWIVVPVAFLILAAVLTRTLEAVSLGWVNRLLGMAFGVVLSVLVLGLLTYALETLDTQHIILSRETKDASVLYYPLRSMADYLMSILIPAGQNVKENVKNGLDQLVTVSFIYK